MSVKFSFLFSNGKAWQSKIGFSVTGKETEFNRHVISCLKDVLIAQITKGNGSCFMYL